MLSECKSIKNKKDNLSKLINHLSPHLFVTLKYFTKQRSEKLNYERLRDAKTKNDSEA